MRKQSWKRFACLVAVLALNAFALLQVTGIAYEPFSWKAFAFVYNIENTATVTPDDDKDAIKTSRDLDDGFFNPSGCFYDSQTGEIVPGGMVASANDPNDCGAGSEACHVYIPDSNDPMDGSAGCYSFLLKGPASHCATLGEAGCDTNGDSVPAPITLDIKPPPVCAVNTLVDPACPSQTGTYNPPPNMNEVAEPLGSPPNAARTALDGSFACGDNTWYETIDLSETDPASGTGTPPHIPVVHNNIPLLCNVPAGGSCILDPNTPPHCADDFFCVEREISEGPGGLCCNLACDGRNQVCDVPGAEGTCVTRAPAPAVSKTGLGVLLGALLAVAALALRRRRRSVA